MSNAVEIPNAAVRAMIAHARREAPRECCGLLIGTRRRIRRVWPARNVRRSATRFQVHPQDHFDAIRAARAERLDVIGAYHSHPVAPAVPSPTDRAEALDPDFLHVIVSLAGRRAVVRGWRRLPARPAEISLRRKARKAPATR